MATESTSRDGSWYGHGEAVGRYRGAAFKWTCLGATLFGISMVFVLLLYVAVDAVRPFSAEPGWYITMSLAMVAPAGALGVYFARRDPEAGWIGATAAALPVFCLLVATGLAILLIEVFQPHEWFAAVVALLAVGGVVSAHRRVRSAGNVVAGERTLVTVVALWLGFVGIPGVVPGLAAVVENGTHWLNWPTMMVYSFGGPLALPTGVAVARGRESTRDGLLAGGLTFAVGVFAVFAAPTVGIDDYLLVVLALSVLVPTGLYVERVVRTRENVAGLALPVAVYGGAVLAAIVVEAFGFAGPAAWLDWEFLTEPHSRFPERAGIYPALVGSIMMMLVIVVSAFPVGVGAAVYLEEYAPDGGFLGRVVSFIEINIGNLAGVPSVVYGLLGLALFIRYANMNTGSVVVGGLTVGLLILPIVIISSQEAIRAVPDSMRQASYGMGATKWQTVRNVVLPEAFPGILTGTILAFGRAIGETAPLLMIGAAAVVFNPPGAFGEKFSAMPRQIFAWSSEPSAAFRHGVLAAGVVTLLVVLLSMNAAAILIRNRYQRRS
jgi:phosphate transport system permease protein